MIVLNDYRIGGIILIKGSWDCAIQQKRYARLYLGLNVIGQEAVTPIGLHSIPIPFMRHDHGLIRYKSFKFPESYGGHKIRCDQEIERLERRIVGEKGNSPLRQVAKMIIDELKYVSEGPYDDVS